MWLYIYTFQETIQGFFPSWEKYLQHSEVVTFTCGLSKDPRRLVNYGYDLFIKNQLMTWKSTKVGLGDSILQGRDRSQKLFKSLYFKSTVPLPGQPLQNQHINYYNHREDDRKKRPRDRTPIHIPSKLYMFHEMMEDVPQSRENFGKSEITESSMWIAEPDVAVVNGLLETCFKISQDQPVAHLRMSKVNVNVADASGIGDVFNLSENIQFLNLRESQNPKYSATTTVKGSIHSNSRSTWYYYWQRWTSPDKVNQVMETWPSITEIKLVLFPSNWCSYWPSTISIFMPKAYSVRSFRKHPDRRVVKFPTRTTCRITFPQKIRVE